MKIEKYSTIDQFNETSKYLDLIKVRKEEYLNPKISQLYFTPNQLQRFSNITTPLCCSKFGKFHPFHGIVTLGPPRELHHLDIVPEYSRRRKWRIIQGVAISGLLVIGLVKIFTL